MVRQRCGPPSSRCWTSPSARSRPWWCCRPAATRSPCHGRVLAVRSAGRVRVLTADARSTAALRNTGLDEARGENVLVLGDGERLQRHACRNLWEASARSGADLVAGRWSRLTGDGTKEQEPPWQQRLYERSRTVGHFAEAPELAVRDALVTGFCLRREALDRHGLRYEEDLTHSEVLFGPLAAAAVGRIALVRRRIVTGRAAAGAARDIVGRPKPTGGCATYSPPRGCPSCARSGSAPSPPTIWCRWSGCSRSSRRPSGRGSPPGAPRCSRTVSRRPRSGRWGRSSVPPSSCWRSATRTECSRRRTRCAGRAPWPRR
ncbi:hypothetical protein NKH18_19820 [Streptomyces sp. M10(2022)]